MQIKNVQFFKEIDQSECLWTTVHMAKFLKMKQILYKWRATMGVNCTNSKLDPNMILFLKCIF